MMEEKRPCVHFGSICCAKAEKTIIINKKRVGEVH